MRRRLQRHDLIAFGLPCPQERLRAIVIAFAALLVAGLKLGNRYAIRCEFAHCPTGGVGSMSITKTTMKVSSMPSRLIRAVQQDGQDRGAGYPTKPSEHQPIH